MVFTRAQAANAETMNTQIESSLLPSISTHERSVSDTEQDVSAGNVPQLVRSYSDVVAGQSRGGFMTPRDELSLRTSESQPAKVSGAEEGDGNKDVTKDLMQSINQDDDGPWIPVGKGGRHSPKPSGPILSPLKLAAIHQAEENLSEADRDLLARRSSSAIIINDEDSSVSQSTGIATPVPRNMLDKGKGVDPREYGEPIIEIGGPSNALQHLPVPKGELDVVAQQAELSFWDMARKSPSAPHLTTGVPDIAQTPVVSASAAAYDPIAELQRRLLDLELVNSVLRAELDAVPKSTPKATSADTKKLETPKVVPQVQKDHIRAITTKYKGNKRVREAPKFVEIAKEESKDGGFRRSRLPDRDSIRPSSYIPKTSSVGHVLERLRRQTNDGSSSPSSSSSSSDSSDESESDSGSSESSRHRRRSTHGHPRSKRSKNRKRRNHHSRSKDQSRKQTSKLKPVAPTVYKGEPIVATFNRWMRESVNFLEDAQVEPSKQIRMVARYTEGKAHTYYLNVIADHEEEWSLEDYFRDIFDACFPSNFRESQRRRLYRFRQDTLTVKEYVAELTEIVDLVGDISPRERVVKFFKSLNFELQIAVRHRGLSPEVSSWDDILDEALWEESVQAALRLSSRAYNASDHRNETRESTPGRRENHARRRAGDFRGRRGEQMSSTGTTPVPEKNTQTSGSSGRSRAPFGRNSRLSTIGVPKETTQLSREEKARLRTENKCFICKQPGHISRACPRGNIVKSKGNGPPGVSANSVRIDFEHHARLEAAARNVQPLESLSVGMVLFDCLLDSNVRASPSTEIAETLLEGIELHSNAEARTSWLNGEMDHSKLDVWRRWLRVL